MMRVDLCGEWTLKQAGEDLSIPAQVPGVVQLDLLREGTIKDPYFRTNELESRWTSLCDWEYSRTFAVSKKMLDAENVALVCKGIDTIARVFINDIEVGITRNMFREYVFDVTSTLREGENRIAVFLTSPVDYAKQQSEKAPYPIPCGRAVHDEPHRNFIRKCGAHFGWDWGPCLLPSGIWRPMHLLAYSGARLANVVTQQHHLENGDVDLSVKVLLDAKADVAVKVSLEIAGIQHEEIVQARCGENRIPFRLRIPSPERWYPAGFGAQPLYDLDVSIQNPSVDIMQMRKRIGFRTVELVREDDAHGQGFFFRVNGEPVFAKGANWIPADALDSRITRKILKNLLTSARDANMNMIRVWGGGIYEHDDFYDLCDELGIMVWQDFMFACALYPATRGFLAEVTEEVRCQVRRLMSHACIVLWCGNNENEQALEWYEESRENRDRYVVDYSRLYIDTIGGVLAKEDPSRTYWPCSPSNGIQEWGDPQDTTRGDVHYWGVWHGGKPFSDYLSICPRFSSEFGFQSFPSIETLSPVIAEEDHSVTSPVMEFRQRSPKQGNKAILTHMARQFRMPEGFENFLYLSQVLQALSIKTACEHWRRLRPLCMGTLYWQLNDIWQGPSWSSLEYGGRWKLLHYLARRFYHPVLISACEKDEHLQVHLTNDRKTPLEGQLHLALWSWQGEVVQAWEQNISIGAFENCMVWEQKIQDILGESQRNTRLLSMRAKVEGEDINNVHFFSPLKEVDLEEPAISMEILSVEKREARLSVTAKQIAAFATLSSGKIFGRFSDNGFLLFPNRTQEIDFYAWEDLDANAFKNALTIRSIRDTYA